MSENPSAAAFSTDRGIRILTPEGHARLSQRGLQCVGVAETCHASREFHHTTVQVEHFVEGVETISDLD